MIKMLLDVDTGIDDSVALLYALRKKGVQVVGITTGCGNVDAKQAAENTCRILDLVGASMEIPVVVGADQPLRGSWDGVVANIHGENGIGNAVLPPHGRTLSSVSAEDFLGEMAERYPGELVLVTLGRLTNVAKTLEKYPDFAHHIKKMVMMGGTLSHCGNVTPVAEANVAGDPLACDRVFLSGMDVTVIGLDVTMKTRLKKEYIDLFLEKCEEEDRPIAEYMETALGYYMRGNRLQDGCLNDCPVHDPLAVIAAVVPGLFQMQSRKARVECEGEHCKGMIVTDQRSQPFDAKDIWFAVDVDEKAAIRELLSVFWK